MKRFSKKITRRHKKERALEKKKLSAMYREIQEEHFPLHMEISLFDHNDKKQTLLYEKVRWTIGGEKKGLRYGENPSQEAALYRLINGNLLIGDVELIRPGQYLASDIELLQSGKHPGKINITDVDNALNIMRYFADTPCTVIVKHNNPCGAALGDSLAQAYAKAYMADRLAAFGGAIALNREVDRETARLISSSYSEVVAAPEYGEGAMDILTRQKNLRIMRIKDIRKLQTYVGKRFLDFKSLIDGGIALQLSYVPAVMTREDLLPAESEFQGKLYTVNRKPTEGEYKDIIFGWLVESGITSNSVIYVKNGVTVGIGTGEQDRVGVAEIARDKAYRKLADRIAWERHEKPLGGITEPTEVEKIVNEARERRGDIPGSVMISDGFFPFRDGIEVGLKEGVSAVAQPGGSLRDFESIEACNEFGAAMVYTGERSFKH